MAALDRYILTMNGTSAVNQQISNVFAYAMLSGGGGAQQLNDAFVTNVAPSITNVLAGTYVLTSLYTYNVDDASDFHTLATTINGGRSGEILPPFVTWTFRFLRTSRLVHDGRKAFGPISESDIQGGLPVPLVATDLANLANLFETDVNDGNGNVWSGRIWKRPGTYKTGVVAAPGQFFPYGNVQFAAVSTQNTRKIGRGS